MIIGIKLYENNILVAEELLKRGDDYTHETDYLPEGAALVNGVLNAKKVLKEGEELVFGYAMQINRSGSIELPPATAHFVDTHDYEGTVLSEKISIAVNQKTARPSRPSASTTMCRCMKKISQNYTSHRFLHWQVFCLRLQ